MLACRIKTFKFFLRVQSGYTSSRPKTKEKKKENVYFLLSLSILDIPL